MYHWMGESSANMETKGLGSEPTGRLAAIARLKPGWRKLWLPTTASTSPLSTSVTTMPACSGGRFLLSSDSSVRVTAPRHRPGAEADMRALPGGPGPSTRRPGRRGPGARRPRTGEHHAGPPVTHAHLDCGFFLKKKKKE